MASSIVKSAAQQLGNLVVEEAKYLYKVKEKIESLQTELEWMECFLRDADTQQHHEKVICKWVSQVRDLAYDAEDIIERYLHGVSHHRRNGIRNSLKWFSCILWTCDAWTLHQLGAAIDDLTIKISEFTSRLRRYGIQIIKPSRVLKFNPVIREERRTYSHDVDEDFVVGFEKDVQKVVDELVLNTHVKVVGVSGTGGLGKTTLARKVFSNRRIKDYFNNNCAWVYVSKEFDRNKIFQEILVGLDKDEDTKKVEKLTEQELPIHIRELLQKRKCLVVLDDIWTDKAWDRLKPAFDLTHGCSSKILITTRKQDLLQHTDPDGYCHYLQPLTPENSWKLLQLKAFLKNASTGGGQNEIGKNKRQDRVKRQKEILGMEMLKHCAGLPIAIVALGGILSTKKTVAEWEDVQNNIASYLMSDMEHGGKNAQILEVLELSYIDLPFYLKPCFLYLGNFPEDYRISTQRLYHLWEAEGFLVIEGEAKKQGGTTYDIGERYLNELIQRSMVQVEEVWPSGRLKTCRVHDVMRDMCLRKCAEVIFFNTIECTKADVESMFSTSSVKNKKLRRCALHVKNDVVKQSSQHGEKVVSLRSLLVFPMMTDVSQKMKILRKIWKSFPLLRVLDLEGVGLESVEGIERLIHLRCLSLRNTDVTELSAGFYDLKYLEILDLRCGRKEIKLYNKFHKMKRIRHLYLPGTFVVVGNEELSLPAGQMETMVNFHPEKCESKDLLLVTNAMMAFSVSSSYWFKDKDVLEGVLEAPVMKKTGQLLINPFHLRILGEVMNEDPMILKSFASHPSFNKLSLKGFQTSKCGDKLNVDGFWGNIFPAGLTWVELSKCEVGKEGLLALEKLPNLEFLQLDGPIIQGYKLRFSPGSFQRLIELRIQYTGVQELELGYGALANLQRLRFFKCGRLRMIPRGLPYSVHIQCKFPCIKGIARYNTCRFFTPQPHQTPIRHHQPPPPPPSNVVV